ncbi:hypothetical protein [uncultured Devosia sp.]|uniref:hypothetical protein n=1 Tax=uncultured Devosia sp. TaxID=211434 RepID=UPI0035CBE7B2
MGKLVKFDQHRPRIGTQPKPDGHAQILIFTGVRYERGTPVVPTNRLDPSRPKRKRV